MATEREIMNTRINVAAVLGVLLFWLTLSVFLYAGEPDVHDCVLALLRRWAGGGQ